MSPKAIAGLALALLALLLAACGTGSEPTLAPPTPSGAGRGLNTFIFYYTDG